MNHFSFDPWPFVTVWLAYIVRKGVTDCFAMWIAQESDHDAD